MPEPSRSRIEAEALVVGYAMSRLDREYLRARRLSSWREAYQEAERVLGVPTTSLKNLRDEFDPYHANARRGWRGRPIRADRQRVMEELSSVSLEALQELVRRVLMGDRGATSEAIDVLVEPPRVVSNVAERLLTGRLAEEHFLTHCLRIAGIEPLRLRDRRMDACGFDFGVTDQPEVAIEVKGLAGRSGSLLFTDREWAEASARKADYWLVVVGDVRQEPRADLVRHPHALLAASCRYETAIRVSWSAHYVLRI